MGERVVAGQRLTAPFRHAAILKRAGKADVAIVVYGRAVAAVSTQVKSVPETTRAAIKGAKAAGVHVYVCEHSLEQAGIARDAVIPEPKSQRRGRDSGRSTHADDHARLSSMIACCAIPRACRAKCKEARRRPRSTQPAGSVLGNGFAVAPRLHPPLANCDARREDGARKWRARRDGSSGFCDDDAELAHRLVLQVTAAPTTCFDDDDLQRCARRRRRG